MLNNLPLNVDVYAPVRVHRPVLTGDHFFQCHCPLYTWINSQSCFYNFTFTVGDSQNMTHQTNVSYSQRCSNHNTVTEARVA